MYQPNHSEGVPAPNAASRRLDPQVSAVVTVTATREVQPSAVPANAVWSWSCRALDPFAGYRLLRETIRPRVGDIAVFEVKTIRNHTRLYMSDLARHRLYEGGRFVGVFGHRYATDAFEAEVRATETLHILTGAGMVGTVLSRHSEVKAPTRISLVGYLADEEGRRVNLRDRLTPGRLGEVPEREVILVLGSGMNAGKTTTACRLTKALVDRGKRVAALKITGSCSPRDVIEMRSTGACFVADFSDYGTPSTYLSSQGEIAELFSWMVADAVEHGAELIVAEVADGALQREVRMVLSEPAFSRNVRGVVLAASCASSALLCVERIRGYGYDTLAVAGRMTNSPLFVRELENECSVPVTGEGERLAELVLAKVGQAAEAPPASKERPLAS